MKSAVSTSTSASVGVLLARLAVGSTLAWAGTQKLLLIGMFSFVTANLHLLPHWMPTEVGRKYLIAVPIAEIALGALILAGCLTRFSGLLASIMLASFAIAVTGFLSPNLKTAWLPLEPTTVYLVLAVGIFLMGPGRFSLDHAVRRNKAGA